MVWRMIRGFRNNMMMVSMLLVAFFTVMSISGAFMGAAKARIFFNSTPMAVFWCLLLAALLISLVVFPAIRKRPLLLAMHLGCCLVIGGGLWGSDWSHEQFRAEDIPRSRGYMMLREGEVSSMLFDKDMTRHERLPFTVRVLRTTATYYDNGMYKDYYSTLEIWKDRQLVKMGTIEVNKPLYYGGYHFYQSSYGVDQHGSYTGLQLTSARGVAWVFAGYGLIFGAIVMHFGAVLQRAAMRNEPSGESQTDAQEVVL